MTAGEKSLKAASDPTKYDTLEVGHSLADDTLPQLRICADNHRDLFDEEEFCIVMQLANDPLIKNLKRRKFYGWPYMPTPRPNQAVFLYNKKTDVIKRLWVLPEVETMIELTSLGNNLHKEWLTMQMWSKAFFAGIFWEIIRKQHDITLLSESEYLEANREKLIKSGCKQSDSLPAEPFDFTKVMTNEVIDSNESLSMKDGLNGLRKTKSANRHVAL